MNKKIRELLNEKINEIFSEMQNDLNIQNGDIFPMDALRMEELQNKLADNIEYVLNYQRNDFELED